jgi:hypothetical protein
MLKKFALVLSMALLAVLGLGQPVQASTTYYYAGGIQGGFGATEPTGLFATVNAHNPTLDGTGPDWESHTLVEAAILQGSGANLQIVEVGLRKATGDAGQKVMVYAWLNNTPCGYALTNLCGTGVNFVHCDTVGGVNNCGQATDNWDIGQVVTAGTNMRIGLQYSGGAWWAQAYVNGGTAEYLGYIPGTLWSGAGVTFTSADEIRVFGEVAPGGGSLGCTDMATGVLAGAGPPITGGFIASVSAPPLASTAIDIDQIVNVTDATKYNVYVPVPGGNVRTFYYGGPGAC